MHSKKYLIANWKMNGLRGDLNQISILNNFIKNLINYRFIKNVNTFNGPGFICNSIDIVRKIENLLKIKKKLQFKNSNKAFSLTSSDNKIKKIIIFLYYSFTAFNQALYRAGQIFTRKVIRWQMLL